jgi:phosphate transport system substrate-binding protein
MRHTFLLLLLAALLFATGNTAAQSTIKIAGTRFTYPLVQQWIQEFSRLHPSIEIQLAPAGIPADSLDILILAYTLTSQDIPAHKTSVLAARYAQLPITNALNPVLKQYQTSGIKTNDLKDLFFQQEASRQKNTSLHVYTRDKPACASVAFAQHFNEKPQSIYASPNVIGVKGDDRTLLQAVKKDVHAVSYNNLGFIYDLQSRKLHDSLAVLPIDLNGNGTLDPQENFYQSLDHVLKHLEEHPQNVIPTDRVNLVYAPASTNKATQLFIQWLLKEGQQYNHSYGFLKAGKE